MQVSKSFNLATCILRIIIIYILTNIYINEKADGEKKKTNGILSFMRNAGQSHQRWTQWYKVDGNGEKTCTPG